MIAIALILMINIKQKRNKKKKKKKKKKRNYTSFKVIIANPSFWKVHVMNLAIFNLYNEK